MITSEIVKYIKEHLAHGHSEDTIVVELLKSGWQRHQIDEAFAAVKSGGVVSHASHETSAVPDFGMMLSSSWARYKKGFWKFVGIELVPVLAAIAMTYLSAAVTNSYII